MKNRFVSFVWVSIVVIVFVSCATSVDSDIEPHIVYSTATPQIVEITATSEPTILPSTPIPEPSDDLVTFVDSGQRLGNGRSWDVALGDLDADGDLDAFVANGSLGQERNAVWLNDGQGNFSIKEQHLEFGMGVALGDLDGDSDLDALVTDWYAPAKIWMNAGDGIFSDSGQTLINGEAMGAALGDVDGDGDLDAYLARDGANSVWLNDGIGNFVDSGQQLGEEITDDLYLGDLDGDGDLDALAGGWDEHARVWLNNGEGIFSDDNQKLTSKYLHIHGLDMGDLNGDDKLDAFMAIAGDVNQVWLNDGGGIFSQKEQGMRSSPDNEIALGDLDGDGDLDAIVAVAFTGDEIWLNDGFGVFTNNGKRLGSQYSSQVQLGDLDGDGDLDAFIAHANLALNSGGEIPNTIWLNETKLLVSPIENASDEQFERWAVLAEKDDYSDVPGEQGLPIDNINNEQMKNLLLNEGWEESHILDLREFNQNDIHQALVWLSENADENDIALFYITGHDSYLNDYLEWDNFFPQRWSEIPSNNRILIVDTCRAATFIQPIAEDPRPHLSIAVAAEDELAWSGLEEEGLPIVGSVFVHYFVAALSDLQADSDADGFISVQEAARMAETEQRNYMHNVVFNVPEFLAIYHQNGAYPDQDPDFPHVIMDDAVGEPVYLHASQTSPIIGSSVSRQKDDMLMTYVPGSEFHMGSTLEEIDAAIALCREHYNICNRWYYMREDPQHNVSLDSFWIDQMEVTNAQYRLCVEMGACVESMECKKGEITYTDSEKADHPVVCVNWQDAQDYCSWVGARLPTEAEWEFAFRGEVGVIFPWGNEFEGGRLNYCDINCEASHADDRYDDGYTKTSPVESHPEDVSWSYTMGMSGNVSEWVADWLGDYSSRAESNPTGPDFGNEKLVKGCSWFFHPAYCRGAARASISPETRFDYVGFRCASSASE
ncbi:MAG: SUMF1/EgtB/PvdO family nonheme iron enzyme [Chloroflexi bacterium]|nr:SUMF1/EgtB/PvdO family nonheme iron enzyme [Chloroflexota bacterium]